jgi:hypothetical protein
MNIATTWTKHVAVGGKNYMSIDANKQPHRQTPQPKQRHTRVQDRRDERDSQRTRLEDECAADVDVARVADGLDALVGAQQRADDERGGLAHAVERAERDRHWFSQWPLLMLCCVRLFYVLVVGVIMPGYKAVVSRIKPVDRRVTSPANEEDGEEGAVDVGDGDGLTQKKAGFVGSAQHTLLDRPTSFH